MPLQTLPAQILEDIAFQLATVSFLGPPCHLVTLLLLSRRFYRTLSLHDNPTLYARIFKAKFDYRPPLRRGLVRNTREQARELISRFIRLKRFKSHHHHNGHELRLDLWMAFCMFLENDGNNGRQLIHARVDHFALNWVRLGGRLHDGKAHNAGWIVENELNALALWLFWLTDADRIPTESPEQRHDILTALSPIYSACFKYLQQTYFPLTHYAIPPAGPPPAPAEIPSLYTPSYYHPLPPCLVPFASRTLSLARPLLVPPALLAFTAREEHMTSLTPFVLPPGFPMTRADARAQGRADTFPVGMDYLEVRKISVGKVDWREEGASWKFEAEWAKLTGCWDPWNAYSTINRLGRARGVYTPGMLSDSLWSGKWCTYDPDVYNGLRDIAANNESIPDDLHIVADMVAMKLRISEHLCHSPSILPFDESAWGQLSAWIPRGTRFDVQRNALLVHAATTTHHYATYSPDRHDGDDDDDDSPFGHDTYDILLTADTDDTFGGVWGRVSFTGRIRPWDGLVVLVRDPQAGLGRWIFRGYLHGGGVLVGRWRETATQPDLVGWEGTWYLQRQPAH